MNLSAIIPFRIDYASQYSRANGYSISRNSINASVSISEHMMSNCDRCHNSSITHHSTGAIVSYGLTMVPLKKIITLRRKITIIY